MGTRQAKYIRKKARKEHKQLFQNTMEHIRVITEVMPFKIRLYFIWRVLTKWEVKILKQLPYIIGALALTLLLMSAGFLIGFFVVGSFLA